MSTGVPKRDLSWLVERPIAHRGLHDKSQGIVENTATAFAEAIQSDYAIECDLQLSADGEAMVFHDEILDRLAEGEGSVNNFTSAELQSTKLKFTADRMQTLAQMLEQIGGRCTLVIEIKSLWDGNTALVTRAVEVLRGYNGPYCLMSFDPDMLMALRQLSPDTVRGIVADRATDPYYDFLPPDRRQELQTLSHMARTQPHFVSFDWKDLPYEPIRAIREQGHPVITWTLRSKEDASRALKHCDQITFEGFRP